METLASIAETLSGDLRRLYDEQLTVVRGFSGKLPEAEAILALAHALSEAFAQSFGLDAAQSAALADLAVAQPPAQAATPLLRAVQERVALQRALVLSGMVRPLLPYVRAAARGAQLGAALTDEEILVLRTGDGQGDILPTVPPVHSQGGAAAAASSPFFEPAAL